MAFRTNPERIDWQRYTEDVWHDRDRAIIRALGYDAESDADRDQLVKDAYASYEKAFACLAMWAYSRADPYGQGTLAYVTQLDSGNAAIWCRLLAGYLRAAI